MKLEIISLGLILFSIIVITLGIIKIHTYPGKIAKARNHPQLEAIEVTSLLGLLVFPLWMAALVWAYSGAVVGTLYAGDKKKEDLRLPPQVTQSPSPDEDVSAGPSDKTEDEG
jgi:hypothetical protein